MVLCGFLLYALLCPLIRRRLFHPQSSSPCCYFLHWPAFAVQIPNILWKTNNTGVFNFESFKPSTSTLSCSKGLQSLRRSTWSCTTLGADESMVGEPVTDGKSGNYRWGRCQTIQKQQKFMHHLVSVCYINFRLVVIRWSFVEDEILGRSVYLSEVWKWVKHNTLGF